MQQVPFSADFIYRRLEAIVSSLRCFISLGEWRLMNSSWYYPPLFPVCILLPGYIRSLSWGGIFNTPNETSRTVSTLQWFFSTRTKIEGKIVNIKIAFSVISFVS